MRDLIRKFLLEYSSAPQGNTEERIREIKRRFDHISELIPTMVKFYTKKYKNSLERIEVEEKKIHYGNENYTGKGIVLKLFFSEIPRENIRGEVWDYMDRIFGINMKYYGVPLNIDVYIKKYERI
jgi:hypothetical protein